MAMAATMGSIFFRMPSLMPDHSPGHPDDPPHPEGSGRVRQGWAFQFGYIRAMIQAVAKEQHS